MKRQSDGRRDFLKLLGVGGVVVASGLAGCAREETSAIAAPGAGSLAGLGSPDDFFFLQLSDTHWGFQGPPNPEATLTLKKAVATINRAQHKPDFIVFTGDLTQTTDDPAVRRSRMREFKEIVAGLEVKDRYFLPGEHDASLDAGAAYREAFGEPFYSFDHKGIHFVALDNVSDPQGAVGDAQLAWLKADLAKGAPDRPIVVFAHRPLFDLFPAWDWATKDGASVVDELLPYPNVTVFYGHIHQENHHMTGHIAHHAARSLIFPLPAPGSQPKRAPVMWDPAHPGQGLGYRRVQTGGASLAITEEPYAPEGVAMTSEARIRVTARKGGFDPETVRLRRGERVVLELVSADTTHGFNAPGLGIRTDIAPGSPTEVRLAPRDVGVFPFHCDVFCGDGHEAMMGQILVVA